VRTDTARPERSDVDAVGRIGDILSGIPAEAGNNCGRVFINVMKNEFVVLNGRIEMPAISVRELDYDTALRIMPEIAAYIPEFLRGHGLMERRVPASAQHSLQFLKRLRGRVIDMLHLLTIDLRFGGGAAQIIKPGGTDFYPSYLTDKLYYRSRLVPAPRSPASEEFQVLRLFNAARVESDQYFHTFAVFEDIDHREITREMYRRLNMGNAFSPSQELYPFIVSDYFTACLNVPQPTASELEEAAGVFEPIFLVLGGAFGAPLDEERILEAFPGELVREGGRIVAGEELGARATKYFSRYSIYRDDELALKGWWRIDVSGS
jgi:hypothetical protein